MNRVAVLVLLVCGYGAILRLDALESRYGPLARPAWARVLTTAASSTARHLQPSNYAWARPTVPYVGGDPASYLKFAREMRSFYQGHVREPMFLAITRGWIWLLGGQDVGISFASLSMSTLAIFGTFLLGRAVASPAVGVLAALALAIDYDAVSWAPEGWRDDTFTAFFVLGTWALLRLRQQPSPKRAAVAGVLGAAACLTRITSVSWLVPGLLVTALSAPRAGRATQARLALLAAGVALVLVAPYLVNCARTFGDPLIAINVHTGYYRNGEGIDPTAPMTARAYIGQKLRTRPVRQLDTAVTGIFVLPINNKFGGFDSWIPRLTRMLRLLSIAGLVLWLFTPDGRLLTVVWITALVPYAFTWNIGDGQAWRFTSHVYPIFLVAAFAAVQQVAAIARALHTGGWPRWTIVRLGTLLAVMIAAGYLLNLGYAALPYYAASESVADGEEVTITAGDRDAVFFDKGWGPPISVGNVTARTVVGSRSTMRLPLPPGRPYRLTLRVDPVCPETPRGLTVLVTGQITGRLGLAFDPGRMGSYDVDVPLPLARGDTKLELIADHEVPAGSCGSRPSGLPPDTPVSLRVWYVRVHPM